MNDLSPPYSVLGIRSVPPPPLSNMFATASLMVMSETAGRRCSNGRRCGECGGPGVGNPIGDIRPGAAAARQKETIGDKNGEARFLI